MAMNTTNMSTQTRLRVGTSVGVMILAAVAIFVLVNYFARQSRFRGTWDWTSVGSNTLSDKTLGLLGGLPAKLGKGPTGADQVIELASFLSPQTDLEARGLDLVNQALDAYVAAAKGRIVLTRFQEYSDVAEANKKIRELKLKERPSSDELIMALGDRIRTIHLGDMLRINPGMSGSMFGGPDEPGRIEENKIEDTLTSNLLAILETEKPKIYFIVGHGEPDTDDNKRDGLSRFADVLRGNGFDVSALNLAEREGVPPDASVVIWLSPTRLMLPKELAALEGYALSGGRLVVSPDLPLEPGRDADALALLAKYGIRSPNGIVCLPLRNPFTGEEVAGRPEAALGVFCRPQDLSSASPITKSFFEQRLTLRMPYSRAFEKLVGDANKSPAFTEDLGHTPKDSWVDLEPLDYTNNPEKEPAGPKVVLTSGTIAPGAGLDDGSAPASRAAGAKPKEGRLVAIGSATLARNEFFDYGRDIYLASVEWAAGREYAAGIGPRPIAKNALADTLSMLPRITGASLILTGLAFLGAGYVWYVRRGTRLGFILGAAVAALPLLFGILSLLFSARA